MRSAATISELALDNKIGQFRQPAGTLAKSGKTIDCLLTQLLCHLFGLCQAEQTDVGCKNTTLNK